MPAEIRVVDQKFFAKLNNGNGYTENLTDFSQHLKGGVLEEIKAVFRVQVQWFLTIQGGTSVLYYDDTANTLRLEIDGKNFANEGFSVGDSYIFNDIAWGFSGVITAMSVGEIVMTAPLSGVTGVPNIGYSRPAERTFFTGTTPKTALKYDFGLIENNEPINFLSKLTNTNLTYLYEGIDHNNPLTFGEGKSFGNNKAAYSGSSKVAFVGYSIGKDETSAGLSQNTTQEFQIEHIFKINPFYRDGELDSLKDIDVPPLDLFNGDMSLKYVFQTEFRTVLNNPNTSMISSYDTQLGSVGYLDESYNGFESYYYVEDLVYTVGGNTSERLEIGKTTNVSFTLRSNLGNFTGANPLIVGHTAIVDSLSYANSKDKYNEVWTDKDLRSVTGQSAISDGLIKNYSAVAQAPSAITVSFDVEFSASQINKLEDNQDYLLYYTFQDPNKTVDTGDKITGRIDVNYYYKNPDVAGLFGFDTFDQYPHPYEFEEGVSVGFTNALTFNESGMMANGRFWLLNSATLNDLKFDVAVFELNNNTWDSLRSLRIDLSEQTTVNGIQQIELDSTRGYVLADGDIFNYLKITTDNNDGTKQYYNVQVGYKMPWQESIEFKNAPSEFYDNTKSLNGLNQKASNYSLNPNALNYGIKVLFDAVVDSTNYVETSEEIEVYDYDTDNVEPDGYTCLVNTYNSEGTAIEGNLIKKDYTEIKAFFTPVNPPVFTEDVNFSEFADTSYKFAHGNRCAISDGLGSFIQRRLNGNPQTDVVGTWANDQAGTVNEIKDTFQNSTLNNIILDKDDPSLYSTPIDGTSINCNANMSAFYGMASQDRFEYYDITGEMFSNRADDDAIAFNIAFHIDTETGVESTLSLMASTGGVLLDLDPDYEPNDLTKATIKFTPLAPDDVVNWALVYNFGKSDCKRLDTFYTGNPKINWNSLNQTTQTFEFEVKRSGDDLEIKGTWNLPTSGLVTNTFNYSLDDDTLTKKFKGFQSLGFSFMSQDQGGFKNVKLTKPTGDYYGILRIEPKDSQSDNTINELSTIIEAPQSNLLTQITGDEKLAILQWDGTSFVVQGLVETSLIDEGQNYKISAELRTRNLLL